MSDSTSLVGPSPSGQLPTAVTSSAQHAATVHKRLRWMWVYTVSSMVVFVLASALFIAGWGIEFQAELLAPWAYWGLHVCNVLAACAAVLLCVKLKPGFAAPISLGALALCTAPAVAMSAISLTQPGLAMWTHVPLLFAIGLVACFLPDQWRRHGIYLFFALFGLYLVLGWQLEDFGWFLYLILVPGLLVTSVWMWDVYLRIAEASTLAAQLASSTERLRIAADLHDIQGHNLQVIALEAELADRLLAKDPAAAQQHIKRVRELVRATQQETTTVITGLRETDLATELRNVVDVLSAAGMQVNAEPVPLLPGVETEQLFSMVLREASTNILRHSNATHVGIDWSVRAGQTILTITNDGLNPAVTTSSVGAGSGLASLTSRFRQAGGTLTYGPEELSFTLTAALPNREEDVQS